MRWWDIPAVVALEAELFADDPWSAEQLWSELAGVPTTRHYLVACPPAGPTTGPTAGPTTGPVVGYAGLLLGLEAAEVQTLGVAPARRRLGIGRLLLRTLLDEARRRSTPQVLLEVRADDPAAVALYASEGFERIGVRRGYYRGRGDALVMRRRLPRR
jgi:ribosomal-protein-alanine N-acetyltransferase